MKPLRIGAVILGAVIITALGIDAADTLTGSNSTLLGQLIETDSNGCPAGMTAIPNATTFKCADTYEVSPGAECLYSDIQNQLQTKENIEITDCQSESVSGAVPWSFISRERAQMVCARSGKRLPSAVEWYTFAIGTPDRNAECNINGVGPMKSGENEACVSAAGVFDAVGNMWEWTSDDIFDGQYLGRTLPSEGYVVQVDSGGVATVSGEENDALGSDYFWSRETGVYAMTRGGFYGSQDDAGVYAVHAAIDPNLEGVAIGFRCVK